MSNISRTCSLAAIVTAIGTTPLPGQFRGEWKTDFSRHTVPLDEIVSGGPPKDGIPAIDRPTFERVADADRWLEDREAVVLVSLGGETRAYPLRILIQHEIVNDEVGGTPVTITYCPLCNTALSFDRRFDGQVLDFGTTGNLRHSDLVMYDRQTETWWQQATGDGIVGEYAGRKLRFIGSPLISWRTFKEQYPGGLVLSRNTGFGRRYARNPYVGYDDPGGKPWRTFFRRNPDDRLRPMERVVALELGGDARAYPFENLREKRVVHDRLKNWRLAVFWVPGTASPVDAPGVARGRDVGSTGVFDRRLGSRTLTFEPAADDRFRDEETGTTWTILGLAIDGPLKGEQLTPIAHGNHFWFAWAAFKPDVKVVR